MRLGNWFKNKLIVGIQLISLARFLIIVFPFIRLIIRKNILMVRINIIPINPVHRFGFIELLESLDTPGPFSFKQQSHI